MRALLLPLVLAVPLLSAFGDPGLGVVVTSNIAVQAGPLPTYAGDPMEGSDGLRASRAANRYRRGTVTPLTIPRSSGIGGNAAPERAPGGAGAGGAGAGLPQ